RDVRFPSFIALGAAFALAYGLACDTQNDESSSAEAAALAACHLTHDDLGPGGHVHACDPPDAKKTTICHIPPGNPANAHTICVGNAAVPAHMENHGDAIGACATETPCGGTGGAPGAGGVPGSGAG